LMTRATLNLKIATNVARKSLISVLAPDSKRLPDGLRFSMRVKGGVTEFSIESASPSTSLSTVLALLRDIALFQEVWLLSHEKDAQVHKG
jgi:hypothetical protein